MTKRKLEEMIKKAFTTGLTRPEFGLLRKESIRWLGVQSELPLAGLVIESDDNPAGDWVITKGSISSQNCINLYSFINSRPCKRGERVFANLIGNTDMGGSYTSIVFTHVPNGDTIIIRGNRIISV